MERFYKFQQRDWFFYNQSKTVSADFLETFSRGILWNLDLNLQFDQCFCCCIWLIQLHSRPGGQIKQSWDGKNDKVSNKMQEAVCMILSFLSHQLITCSKSPIEALEEVVKYFQS